MSHRVKLHIRDRRAQGTEERVSNEESRSSKARLGRARRGNKPSSS